MNRPARILVALIAFAIVVYVSIFPVAEIFTEVVVLRTYDSDGSPHETRLTVIDRAGAAWVRGRPYRGWFRRVEANPRAELYRDDVWQPVRAVISRHAADAAAYDRVMLETYGLGYRYVDFIARISANEIPVRLVPQAP